MYSRSESDPCYRPVCAKVVPTSVYSNPLPNLCAESHQNHIRWKGRWPPFMQISLSHSSHSNTCLPHEQMAENFLSVNGCGKTPASSNANASHSCAASVLKFQKIHPWVWLSNVLNCASIYPLISFLKSVLHSFTLLFPLQLPTYEEEGYVPS